MRTVMSIAIAETRRRLERQDAEVRGAGRHALVVSLEHMADGVKESHAVVLLRLATSRRRRVAATARDQLVIRRACRGGHSTPTRQA
jgi:hypothetical protein